MAEDERNSYLVRTNRDTNVCSTGYIYNSERCIYPHDVYFQNGSTHISNLLHDVVIFGYNVYIIDINMVYRH